MESSPRAAEREPGVSEASTPQPDKPVVARGLPATYEENFAQINVVGALYESMFTAWHIKIRAQWTEEEKAAFVDSFLAEIRHRQTAGDLDRIKTIAIDAELPTVTAIVCNDGTQIGLSAPIVKANEMLWRLEGK